MKFIISRTSDIWGENSPCKEAKREKAISQNWRTVKTLEEAKKHHWFDQWYNNGINHREERGLIVCDSKIKHNIWVIEINDLTQLLGLAEKYGELVISLSENDYKGFQSKIEIYDDYRE